MADEQDRAETTPVDASETERLRRENQSLKDRLAARERGSEAVRTLQAQNRELLAKLEEAEAERGPAKGTRIWFHKADEPVARPGRVLSDGFTDFVKQGGSVLRFAYVEYEDPEDYCHEPDTHGHKDHDCRRAPHAFRVTAAFDALLARPNTWCLDEDLRRNRESLDQRP